MTRRTFGNWGPVAPTHPEHKDLTRKPYWDKRARGLGATAARPACSCGAENLLGLKGDRYRGESILIAAYDPGLHALIEKTFRKAKWRWKDPAKR